MSDAQGEHGHRKHGPGHSHGQGHGHAKAELKMRFSRLERLLKTIGINNNQFWGALTN